MLEHITYNPGSPYASWRPYSATERSRLLVNESGDRLAKIYLGRLAHVRARREAYCLASLQSMGLTSPCILNIDTSGPYPIVEMSRVTGLPGLNIDRTFADLAEYLAKLHSHTLNAPHLKHGWSFEEAPHDVNTFFMAPLRRDFRLIGLAQLLQPHLEKLCGSQLVRIHRDLKPAHLLHDVARKGLLTLIDWEASAVAPPALDYASLLWQSHVKTPSSQWLAISRCWSQYLLPSALDYGVTIRDIKLALAWTAAVWVRRRPAHCLPPVVSMCSELLNDRSDLPAVIVAYLEDLPTTADGLVDVK